ncbi:colicin-E1-like isoform X1 [Protopterus annectens]|uniref:colicin-E1-like isoform X1 n=1 Tax=Protopterus annectens TaxID=7888 RepID=UPI001CFB6272|nr:colicin-E1-like isoform X1 [Protopterus annectens]
MEDLKTEKILLEFQNQKASKRSAILAADDSLTEQMKEAEAAKQTLAESEKKNNILEEQKASTEKQLKTMGEHHEKNIATLIKTMEDNRERYKEENLQYCRKRQKELEDNINKLQDNINKLKSDLTCTIS